MKAFILLTIFSPDSLLFGKNNHYPVTCSGIWPFSNFRYGGIIMWIIIIAILISIAWYFFSKGECPIMRSRQSEALDILKNRYARGEISKEEFEEMKKNLE